MFRKLPVRTAAKVISTVSIVILSYPSLAIAQSQTSSNQAGNQEESITDLAPDRRRGGASRRPQPENSEEDVVQMPQRRKPAASRPFNSQCNFDPQQLTALIPQDLVGVTATNEPTLFFSVPEISATTEIEFVLRGPNDKLVQTKTFQGQGKAGIMSLKLPRVAKVSTANAQGQYHWYLSVICNPEDRAYDVVVEGLLQPIELASTVKQKIETATLDEQVKLYQDHQIWHERLNTLAELKRSRPHDSTILQLWSDLLKSVNLDPMIGQKPLLEPEILTFNY